MVACRMRRVAPSPRLLPSHWLQGKYQTYTMGTFTLLFVFFACSWQLPASPIKSCASCVKSNSSTFTNTHLAAAKVCHLHVGQMPRGLRTTAVMPDRQLLQLAKPNTAQHKARSIAPTIAVVVAAAGGGGGGGWLRVAAAACCNAAGMAEVEAAAAASRARQGHAHSA